jgi:heptosyltransferase-3
MAMTRALVVRLDSDGDVLLAGPAVRAVAAGSDAVTLLVSPAGEQAARLLPGVDDLIVWSCPWTGFDPPAVDAASVDDLVARLRQGRYDVALVLTSYHQSPLPAALLLRLAGVSRIVASSVDYPGSLLDVRHPPGGPHEVERGLSLARAAGFTLPPGDDDRLQVRQPLPVLPNLVENLGAYVVVHPSASVPARAPSPGHARRVVQALARSGRQVVLTGAAADAPLAATVVAGEPGVEDLSGRTTFAELAAVLAGADCVVSGNTGPAHLAAAVGTPVVSLFAPVVPAEAWRPWGVPSVLLGDQHAPCAGSRARTCPVAGHPCLDGIDPTRVVAAVERLTALVAA